MKILAICPITNNDKSKDMFHSFRETKSKDTDIVFRLEGTVTEAFNTMFINHPDYDFYFMANDDILFKTKNWDLKLANKGKISWGSDGIQNENLPCFPMIDGDIVRALGWLQMSTLNKYCGDVVWNVIGKQLDILNYCPEVKIEHLWHESQVDMDIHKKDMGEFADWLPVSHRDVEKVREALNGVH